MLLIRKLSTGAFAEAKPFRKPLWLVKMLNYEYWHLWFFYAPLVPYLAWLMLKSRSVKFYEYCNPSIESGGLKGESKMKIMESISAGYKPKSFLFNSNHSFTFIKNVLAEQNIAYPVIAKPDVGEMGKGVSKIHSEIELAKYLAGNKKDFMIQEYVNYPVELGIFYVRLPYSPVGKITSVAQKKFLSVTGTGYLSVRELMMKSDRARLQVKRFKKDFPGTLNYIPSKGEEIILEPIGNHCRGTQFINANHLVNEKLNNVFDKIALRIPGFYFGRFDLRVPSVEDLYRGENISIVELNGAGSIPAHIFDPSYKLWNAWNDVAFHWNIAAEIAIANRKKKKLHAAG